MPHIDNDLTDEGQREAQEELPPVPEGWQRWVRDPITGWWVVAGRPGQRMVTSEQIRKLLEDSP
jgi:hypothetical protein